MPVPVAPVLTSVDGEKGVVFAEVIKARDPAGGERVRNPTGMEVEQDVRGRAEKEEEEADVEEETKKEEEEEEEPAGSDGFSEANTDEEIGDMLLQVCNCV